ncbi:hypothetical protein [Treponema zioleckii]|uniref:hypothetical protein n=1 Tax=Treponema zioleckii TaxID=331680 RepID=UPI00168A6BA5|nr:hypothetical protein [Treponema zioleckii]
MAIDIDAIQEVFDKQVKKSASSHAEIMTQEKPKNGVASFKINGWTLYSYEKLPAELDSYAKTARSNGIDALGEKTDAELIKEKNPLLRVIAEKQMENHIYRIYLDYRFGSINRQILMCDEKWICVSEGNVGELMAYAEYLNTNEKFGAFEKLEKIGPLGINFVSEKCIICPLV